jgi:hypothetical protein
MGVMNAAPTPIEGIAQCNKMTPIQKLVLIPHLLKNVAEPDISHLRT